MDVFVKGICLLSLIFLVSQAFCEIYSESIHTRDKDMEEFLMSLHDGSSGADAIEDLYAGENEGVEVQDTDNVTRVITTLKVTNGERWGDWGSAQFCPDGSYAVGYDMKIEPDQGSDTTALNAIKLLCEFPDGKQTGDVTSTQGKWGSWVGRMKCPSRVQERLFLTAFDLQVEKYQGKFPHGDTAAKYVKFTCRDQCGRQEPQELVKPPGHGFWGTWGAWSAICPHGTAICGIKTKVEKPQGTFGDDTALNDVQFYCCL